MAFRHLARPQLGGRVLRVLASSESSPNQRYRYRVRVKQPLGLVLAEDAANKRILVDEIVAGGHADDIGAIQVGDVLTGCSGVTLKEAKLSGSFEKEGYGARPYDNWQEIWVDCQGLKYETVMAALASNNPRWYAPSRIIISCLRYILMRELQVRVA